MKAWPARRRRNIGCDSGRGLCCFRRPGLATRAIGREVGCTTGTASKWRVRYAERRLAGLDETGDRGNDPKYTARTDKRILAVLDRPVPAGYARWNGPLIAEALGDVDVQYVWRFLRAHKIDLAARKSWCESNDPDFAAKAAAVVGLYMKPPENALVLAVDEKPSIQALERSQGYLKMPNGRALTRPVARLQAARHDDALRSVRRRHRQGDGTPVQAAPAPRISRLHEPGRRPACWTRHPCHPRQPQHPQAEERSLAEAPSERALPFHADPRVLAQPGRNLVLDPRRQGAPGRIVQFPWRTQGPHQTLSSRPTTRLPAHSNGRRPRSTKSASSPVSRINDSGYYPPPARSGLRAGGHALTYRSWRAIQPRNPMKGTSTCAHSPSFDCPPTRTIPAASDVTRPCGASRTSAVCRTTVQRLAVGRVLHAWAGKPNAAMMTSAAARHKVLVLIRPLPH